MCNLDTRNILLPFLIVKVTQCQLFQCGCTCILYVAESTGVIPVAVSSLRMSV